MENQTPKHFVLQLGSLISLYLSLGFLLSLLFGVINLKFPDATEGYWAIESGTQAVRLGIAMVIVFFPTYIILTRLVNTLRRKEKNGSYLALTKWLVYLSLLLGGGILLGDLVAIIMAFLEGDMTQRFIFKAVAVLVVVGLALYYYILDARGHWLNHETTSKIYGYGSIALVAVILCTGFTNIDTPSSVREMKLDEKQVNDLREIQWRIQDYLLVSSTTPTTLADAYPEFPVPTAPENRPAYTYERTENGFKLCATFTHNSINPEGQFPMARDVTQPIINGENWNFKAGKYCFDRIIK